MTTSSGYQIFDYNTDNAHSNYASASYLSMVFTPSRNYYITHARLISDGGYIAVGTERLVSVAVSTGLPLWPSTGGVISTMTATTNASGVLLRLDNPVTLYAGTAYALFDATTWWGRSATAPSGQYGYYCWSDMTPGTWAAASRFMFQVYGYSDGLIVKEAFGQSVFVANSTATWTDITDDTMSLNIKRGRQHELDRIEAGTAVVTLNNASGNYWRNNTSGAYYIANSSDVVRPLTPIKIEAVDAGILYPIFYGVTESLEPGWIEERGGKSPIMTIQAVDFFKSFARYSMVGSSPGAILYPTTAGAIDASAIRFQQVLTTIGFPTSMQVYYPSTVDGLPVGALTPPNGGTNAMEYLQDIATAEQGQIFITGSGSAVFHLQRFRNTMTSSATFNSSDMLYVFPELVDDDTFIYNEARITANPSTDLPGTEQVYLAAASTIVEQGERALVRTDSILNYNYDAFAQAYKTVNSYDHSAIRCQSLTILPDADPSNLYPKVFGYDISTKITLQLNNTTNPANINSEYHIEGIEHHWGDKTDLWETKWQLWQTNQYRRIIDAHDGWIYNDGAVYATVQSASETSPAYINNSTGEISVGQRAVVNFSVDRGALQFDLSTITTGTILSADLVLHTVSTAISTDVSFGVYVVGATGTGSGISWPMVSTDYGLIGTFVTPFASSQVNFTAGSSYLSDTVLFTFNTTGVDKLNSTVSSAGSVSFGLRSSDDISPRSPSSANQFITFNGGGTYGFTSTSLPQLFLRMG